MSTEEVLMLLWGFIGGVAFVLILEIFMGVL